MTDVSQYQPPAPTGDTSAQAISPVAPAADFTQPPAAAQPAPTNSYVDTYTPPVTTPTAPVADFTQARPDMIVPTPAATPAAEPAQSTPAAQTAAEPAWDFSPNSGATVTPTSDELVDADDQSLPAMNAQNMPSWQGTAEPVTAVKNEPSEFVPMGTAQEPEAPSAQAVAEQFTLPTGPAGLPTPPDEMLLPSAPPVAAAASAQASQSLEDQNIFTLLGIDQAKDEEKESFLDELQEVIWQDFLDTDLELLVTQDELTEFNKIKAKTGIQEEARQAEMIEFLEKLIPDLEKIMLDKALELKEEMVRERVKDMSGVFAANARIMAEIEKARDLINDDQWRDAATVLNAIRP